MGFSFDSLCGKATDVTPSGEAVVDKDAVALSHVGTAAYEALRKNHSWYHNTLWNVTSGAVIGSVHQTPTGAWELEGGQYEEGHSDWFPEKMAEIVSRTEVWCDLMSLGPPDGLFMDHMKMAIAKVAERAKERHESGESERLEPVILRFMFGNIVGLPVNCNKVLKKLMEGVDVTVYGKYINVWVGAWRRGVSWNHAKIIAVDGKFLHTGGHNLWDYHYLKNDPVHDLSLEMKGKITSDGHYFANEQWSFIEKRQSTLAGQCVDKLPDYVPLLWKTRVTVSEWPTEVAGEFPPLYSQRLVPKFDPSSFSEDEESVPLISVGRYGVMLDKSNLLKARPADDAFIAMINSSKTIIRCALQDIGPVRIPGTEIPLPGTSWPKNYLQALGTAIWTRGVDVEIVLSSPGSIPGDLEPTQANYGNGWSCEDVASEIIKTIREDFAEADDAALRKKVDENLRICFLKNKGGASYATGVTVGMHAKHFIVDDLCTYIGSQNLYVCDLAEWGVIIDHEGQVQKIMNDYWTPMWECSYTKDDCDVQKVMDGLDVDRNGETPSMFSVTDSNLQMANAAKTDAQMGSSEFYDVDDADAV